jgi:antitoxin (DNA-binding transcriptional repressor) of toxin-antitoxin stability system
MDYISDKARVVTIQQQQTSWLMMQNTTNRTHISKTLSQLPEEAEVD